MTTSQFPPHQPQHSSAVVDPQPTAAPVALPHGALLPDEDAFDVTKRDRFELLSAYLDGEVNPDERQMVNHWLAQDYSARCLYERLVCLRTGVQSLPVEADCSVAEVLSGVLGSLNRRLHLACMATGGVMVMAALSMLSGSWGPRYGLTDAVPPASTGQLRVALDEPAFPIPKAATAGFVAPEEGFFSKPQL